MLRDGSTFYFSKMTTKVLIIQHDSPEPSHDYQKTKSMFPPLGPGCTFDNVSIGRVSWK